jgi:GAF domain-containing protein
MTATPDDAARDPRQIIAELQRKLVESRAELAARNSAYSERIAYQAAANDVLKVMSASPGDPQPVFDLIVERARDLCGGYGATVYQFDGTLIHWRAATGVSDDPSARQAVAAMYPMGPTREWPAGRAIIDRKIIHISDLETEPGLTPALRGLTVKSAVSVPLMRGGLPVGVLSLGSRERGGFTDTQIELLKTFAEQAVLAIRSAETFHELNARTRDLSESLQQQTATADVLKIISRSAFDLKPVFGTIVQTASRLCEAEFALIYELHGDRYKIVAANNAAEAFVRHAADNPLPPGRGSLVGRTALERKPVHIPDCLADPEYLSMDYQAVGQYRTMLGVPLLRAGQPIGIIGMLRTAVRPFTEKQIELVTTFADQAVIAIENARLFEEVQARTRDLQESLQQQTATAEVLKAISRSTFDLPAVLYALVETAVRLCGADKGTITRQKDGAFYRAESCGFSEEFMTLVRNAPVAVDRHTATGRALLEGVVVHIPDIETDRDYSFREGQRIGDFRSLLGVPMLREGVPVGVITMTRTEPRGFSDKQIELAITFADQAAIAIENVRLFDEVQARTRELAKSLDDLRTAQDRLVQTEKLASLGQLTAGIAHEIKNPLNFVNNFSALSVELTNELNDALTPVAMDGKVRGEIDELTGMLKDNLHKVVQHGKRADSIVKNMLLHSREGSGEHRPADINSLLDESLNLAYHGARAEKGEFNIVLQRDFDVDAGTIELFPQEITRALLNLISNGVYAATRRKTLDKEPGFEPTLRATTKNLGNTVEICIRDNGTGIPAEVREKMFNPFFTTKPAGEGTGLGLSITHDIIVKQHGGSIDVETEPGVFTEFKLVLPRTGKM